MRNPNISTFKVISGKFPSPLFSLHFHFPVLKCALCLEKTGIDIKNVRGSQNIAQNDHDQHLHLFITIKYLLNIT